MSYLVIIGGSDAGISAALRARELDSSFHEMTVEALSDLHLSYTPPLGSPWDRVQMGAQEWSRSVTRRK